MRWLPPTFLKAPKERLARSQTVRASADGTPPGRSVCFVSGEPRAVPAMTGEQFLDFANEMYVAVAEEAYLWELPTGSCDMEADGSVQHGPWRPEDCSAALVVGLTAGFLGCCVAGPRKKRSPVSRPLSSYGLRTSGLRGPTAR
jgi:hypothetical protein